MKCTIKSLLALMAGAVMLASCNDDYFETNSDVAKTGNMSFTATVDGADSRASFTGDSLSFMKPNSKISVFSSGENNKFTMNGKGIFTGNCVESDEYYAISPYSENHKYEFLTTSSGYFVIDWNGAEQTVELNENYAPMIAHVNTSVGIQNVPLFFKNVCALIKFTTDYKCKSITLKSRGGEYLAAKTLSIGYQESGKLVLYNYSNPSKTITLTGKDGGDIEAGTYYIPIMRGSLSEGVDITFTNKYNEKTCTKSFTNKVSLACGEFVDLGSINIKSEMVHLAGKGTEADPYLIHDFDQLMEMHDFVNCSTGGADCYKLAEDIDCQGREISPIGNSDRLFCGTFDGGNHCIKNLCIKGSQEYLIQNCFLSKLQKSNACAFFSFIKEATIKNLTIDSPKLDSGNNRENQTFSPFVGVAYSSKGSSCKILNCKLTGDCTISKTSNEDNTHVLSYYGFIYGGFVGCNQSNLDITDCSADMRLNTYYLGKFSSNINCLVGGFIGLQTYGVDGPGFFINEFCNKAKICNCRNNSPCIYVTVEKGIESVNAGGFIGEAFEFYEVQTDLYFQNCVNNASFDITANDVEVNLGGFVGNNDSDGGTLHPTFKNCVNNGNLLVNGGAKKTKMGGFNGYNYNDDTRFINCANTGKLFTSAGDNAPGAISYENGDCTNCYNCSTYDYKIIVESPGKMTNTGHKSIDEVVNIMNSTELVWKNGDICNWRKKTVNGREILDLYTVKGPNIPQ